MRFSTLIFVASAAVAVNLDRNGKVDYTGYQVLRVPTPEDITAFEEQVALLEAVELHHDALHFDVAVPGDAVESFKAFAEVTEVLAEDLGALLATEGDLAEYPGSDEVTTLSDEVGIAALPSVSWFQAYHAYADHNTFLRDLQGAFPSNSELFTIGTSFEGRTMTGIHLWGASGKNSKPAIYFHGNVHAREWITSKVAEFMAYQLVVNYNNSTVVKNTLDNYDFYIIPVVNPDGFVYTQTSNRLWRKNRQTRSGTSSVGTDINRNWPYQWTGSGSSTSPSSETYRGAAAGDTPEVAALKRHADSIASSQTIKLYIDWHSYGQYVLFPYGYSCSARVPNYTTQQALASGVASAIRASGGVTYTYGPTCTTLYQVNGGSNDYMQEVNKVPYPWTIEVRDTGRYGFELPANQIYATALENWNGMLYMWQNF